MPDRGGVIKPLLLRKTWKNTAFPARNQRAGEAAFSVRHPSKKRPVLHAGISGAQDGTVS